MPNDKSVLDLSYKSSFDDNDSVVAEIGAVVSRVKMSTLKAVLNQWNNISNKPFSTLDSNWFTVNNSALSLSSSITSSIHSHLNKNYLDKIGQDNNGKMLYNSDYIITKWDKIENKPFSTLSSDFVVDNGELSIDSSLINMDWDNISNKPFDSLSEDFTVSSGVVSVSSNIKHIHSNKSVIDKFSEVEGQLLYDGSEIGGSGLDFSALSDAMTTGTLTGLTITADTTNENFDITVTGLPTIAIDSNGYWTIDGVSTGHQSKGDNGLTPTIDSTSKHWMIGSTDTNVVAEGQDGVSPNITVTETTTQFTVTIVDATGTTSFNIPKMLNDVDIIKGRVNTVADLANVSNPEEGWVYLVGLITDTSFQKYIYINRDNISRWEIVGGSAVGNYAPLDIIADEFDSTNAYIVGDIVIYQNDLYKFKSAHTANTAWNSSEVDNKTVAELIADIDSGGSSGRRVVDNVTAQEIADSINNIWEV